VMHTCKGYKQNIEVGDFQSERKMFQSSLEIFRERSLFLARCVAHKVGE